MLYSILLCLLMSAFSMAFSVDRCDMPCSKLYKPVCGSTGITYNNFCFLHIAMCRSHGAVGFAHLGKCRDDEAPKCAGPCSREYNPICGSDGINYNNPCLFRIAICKSGLTLFQLHFGVCTQAEREERCSNACTREMKLVCGSDGHTYPNPCVLNNASCRSGGQIKMVHEGNCQ